MAQKYQMGGFVFIVVVALLVLPLPAWAFSGGSGTPDDPYLVATVDDLYQVRNNLSASYRLIADLDLGVPPYNQGGGWLPIGTSDSPFTGLFDGNGHVIRNLFINRTTNYLGLFGCLKYGWVKNLVLENVRIVGGQYATDVGGLVGCLLSGQIVNCHVTGTVQGGRYVGGLVGSSTAGSPFRVGESSFIGTVTGSYRVGGLVGDGSDIQKSYVNATVTGGDLVGGVVGSGQRISNCRFTGTVSGRDKVGGLAGEGTNIQLCYAVGEVSGNQYVGGLVGYGKNIFNTFAIVQTSGVDSVGGLIGYREWGYDLQCSYSAGSVSGISAVGGLQGSGERYRIVSGFWNIETSGQTWSAAGIGKTTAEMRQSVTFTDYDFVDIWDIEENVTYPWLKSLPRPAEVMSRVVGSISVTPAAVDVPVGRTAQLEVWAHYSDGTMENVTSQAFYQTGNPSVATVSSGGLVTGVAQGSTQVTVTYQGLTATVPVTVAAPVVESLSVAPASVNLPAGRTQQLAVTALMSDGTQQNVTAQASYAVGNASVASVSASGLVTAKAQGSTTIAVSYGGKTATVPVTVTAPVPVGIAVQPDQVSLKAGEIRQLTVLESFSDGSVRDVTALAGYQSSDPSVAEVDSSGLVRAVGAGSATVTVTHDGFSAAVSVSVAEAAQQTVVRRERGTGGSLGSSAAVSPADRTASGSGSSPQVNRRDRSGGGSATAVPVSRATREEPASDVPVNRRVR